MTDKELLKKLKKDKNSGLSAAIDLYSGLLYKIAGAIILPVGSYEDVEECVSDSFLAFYNQADKLDTEKSSIKNYLAIIVRRKAIDVYRSLKKEDTAKLDEGAEVSADFTSGSDSKSALYTAIKNLGEPDTQIIIRKYLLGETAAQIAEDLSMSEQAVQKRIERSRQKLRIELGGVFNG